MTAAQPGSEQVPPEALRYSIVMPAYNEQDVLTATVDMLCDHLDGAGYDFELVIVDDASTDDTGKVLAELAGQRSRILPIYNGGPNGYGHAIRRGLDVATGDAIAVVTSDGSDAPADVAAYFDKIAEGYDCAFGQRFGEGSEVVGYPIVKRWVNRFVNTLLGWMTGSKYRDFTNGFKCYRREVVEAMSPIVSGQFNITIELSLKAALNGYSYAVVPNDWHQREAGTSSFSILKLVPPYAATLLYCLTLSYLTAPKRNPSRGAKAEG